MYLKYYVNEAGIKEQLNVRIHGVESLQKKKVTNYIHGTESFLKS